MTKVGWFIRWFLKNLDVAYESESATGKVKVTVCYKDVPVLIKEFKL